MTIENNGDFYGFKKAGNLDNTPISYPTIPSTEPMSKNTRTQNSSGAIWIVLLLAVALVVAFYSGTLRLSNSSDSIPSVAKSNSEDFPQNSLADNTEVAVESYMSENYKDYEYISKEQNGDSTFFYYQIKEDTEFLSILTPITLSCDNRSESLDIDYMINTSDSVREWHLDGEWSYTDDVCDYNLIINRSEGDTLYAEYSFSDKLSTYTNSSDGEISLTITSDNDEHYHTEGNIEMDIYPDGATLEIGGDGAGIYLNGVWLNKVNEYNL